MSWQAIFTAMLPEHLLLAGIVVLIGLEIAPSRPPAIRVVAARRVAAATAAVWLAAIGYVSRRFPDQYSVDPPRCSAKAIVLALAVPVLLISRDDFGNAQFHILLLSSLYGVCLLLSADSFLTLFLGLELMSLPVYALVLLAFRRSGERRGGAQVPGSGRHRDRDAVDGRLAPVRQQRLAGALRVR